jgi:hypothetical protein
MLYVEKDLSAIARAVFSQWENAKDDLDGKYLQACNARVSPMDIVSAIKKGEVHNIYFLTDADDANVKEL